MRLKMFAKREPHPLADVEWFRHCRSENVWTLWKAVQFHSNGAWMQCAGCNAVKWLDS